jgi:putative RNA 2'-phosphotransferase
MFWKQTMKNSLTETSKFLSYVLRHEPQAIGIELDSQGWVDIDELIQAANQSGKSFDRELIEQVVATNEKKRFTLSDDGLRIRAAQGHSTDSVKIEYPQRVPPEFLYHGTASRFVESIKKEGLKSQQRHHVHLSENVATATEVGKRYGQVQILIIAAGLMHQQGFKFYCSENNVWLTDEVPVKFIEGI